jgi:hypothetical protein
MQRALMVQVGVLAADVDVRVMPDNMLVVPRGGAAEEREHVRRPMVHPPAVSDSKVATVVEAATQPRQLKKDGTETYVFTPNIHQNSGAKGTARK